MTIALRYLFSLLTLLLACLLPSFAASQERTWISEGIGGEITARDCAQCDEDIGITIACQGEGGPARISVPFAASNERPGDGARITFQLDRDEFAYDTAFEEQGAVGFVPQFSIRPNDPLIAALQSAREARVIFEGRETRIGLRGSGSALEIFAAHCGWTGIPFDPTPLIAAVATDAPPDGPIWLTTEYTDETGAPAVSLVYGVPETDAILLSTTCVTGTGARSVRVNLLLDTGALPPGEAVEARIGVAGATYTYPGKVFEESTESAGLSFDVGSRAPLWNDMRAGGDMSFGIVGGASVGGSAASAAAAVDAFTNACFAPATAAPAAPLIQLNLDLGSVDGNATGPAEPLVKLNLGDSATPRAQPLIDLSATSPQANAAPLIQLDLGASQKPVLDIALTTPGGVPYTCDDGSTLSVEITDTGAGKVAKVALSDGESLSMFETQSTFAERYTAGDDTLRVSDGILLLTRKSSRHFCEAR